MINLVGDAFSRNRNPFNLQAMELESVKKTGMGIKNVVQLWLEIGINFIFWQRFCEPSPDLGFPSVCVSVCLSCPELINAP